MGLGVLGVGTVIKLRIMVSDSQTIINQMLESLAEELKKLDEIKPPTWTIFVKTGHFKQRPPVRQDWWYIRAAAVFNSINRLGPVGVQKLRTKYGGRKRRGHKSEHFYKGSGSIVRKILQQLEKAGLIKQAQKGVHKGRILTPKGKSFLAKLEKQFAGVAVTEKKFAEKPKQEKPKEEKVKEERVKEEKVKEEKAKEVKKAEDRKEEKKEDKKEEKKEDKKEEKKEDKKEEKKEDKKEEKLKEEKKEVKKEKPQEKTQEKPQEKPQIEKKPEQKRDEKKEEEIKKIESLAEELKRKGTLRK